MKTIYNKTIIAATALVFALSCQGLQDITTPDTPGDDSRKIEFKSLSVPMAAGQQSVVSAGLFAGDPINMDNVRLGINASGQVTPETPVLWAPGQIKNTDFLAYSPYDETYSIRSEVKFAVKADQSTAAASAASDLLVAQALSKPADGAVALNFEHKLSQISVYLDNRTGKDITKVTFASLVDNVVLDLNTGDVTAGSSTSDIVAYNDAARKCYSVIVPAGTFALDLKIALSDGTVLSRKTSELSFAEGKSYDNANEPLVLEDVVVESINVNLTVSEWTYGGNVSFDEYEVDPVFEVMDVNGNPVTSPVELSFGKCEKLFFVNSNVNWTAVSDTSWLNVTPSEFEAYGEDPEQLQVSIVAAANSGDARSAKITFSADGFEDFVIIFNQASYSTLSISASNITYQTADVTFTSSSTVNVYYNVLIEKTTYDQFLTEGYTRAEIVKTFLHIYADQYGMTDAEYLAAAGQTETITINYTGLSESTKFVALACFFDADANPAGNGAMRSFTTAAKPAADPDYAALLGTYTFNAYDYFNKASVSGTLVVAEGVVNESYKISIPGIGWCPESNEYIDHFECPWDKAGKKSFSLISGTIGDMGMSWIYGNIDFGTCEIHLDVFFFTAESAIDTVVLTADANGNLSATSPTVPAGDYLCLQSGIVNAAGPTGYANGILIFDSGMNFTKQVAPAAKNAVQHSVFEMPRLLKKQTFKAHKAIR